jgi:hypothetical protein
MLICDRARRKSNNLRFALFLEQGQDEKREGNSTSTGRWESPQLFWKKVGEVNQEGCRQDLGPETYCITYTAS